MLSALLLAASWGLAGCGLGGLVYGDRVHTETRPFLVQDDGSHARARRIGQGPSPETLTAQTLRHQWGPPDSIVAISDGSAERWIYRNDRFRWHGSLLILVVVPLPLLIPVGYAYTEFLVQDGIVLEASEVRSRPKYGGFCGVPIIQVLMLQAAPFVCTAGEVRLTEP